MLKNNHIDQKLKQKDPSPPHLCLHSLSMIRQGASVP